MTSESRRVLDFIYVHPIVFWRTCKAHWVGLLVSYANTSWITRQGHLRRFDEAIARFVDGNFDRGLVWCPGRWRQREPWDLAHAQTLFSPVGLFMLQKPEIIAGLMDHLAPFLDRILVNRKTNAMFLDKARTGPLDPEISALTMRPQHIT